jgi:hypothetical protein
MTIPRRTPLRSVNLVVASDPSCRCANAFLSNVQHSLQGRSGLSDLAVNRTLMPSRRCD